jgi:serine/threonine protein kinase
MLHQVTPNSMISKNVVTAYQEIHAREVLHRDVRPQNILVRSDNSVVVVDFELSDLYTDAEVFEAEMKEVSGMLASLHASF